MELHLTLVSHGHRLRRSTRSSLHRAGTRAIPIPRPILGVHLSTSAAHEGPPSDHRKYRLLTIVHLSHTGSDVTLKARACAGLSIYRGRLALYVINDFSS